MVQLILFASICPVHFHEVCYMQDTVNKDIIWALVQCLAEIESFWWFSKMFTNPRQENLAAQQEHF